MKKRKTLLAIIVGTLLFISVLAFLSALWYKNLYGDVGFSAIIFTLTAENGGAVEKNLLLSFFLRGLLPSIILTVLFMLFLWGNPKKGLQIKSIKKNKTYQITPFSTKVSLITSVCLTLFLTIIASDIVSLPQYIASSLEKTTIYEKEYRDPESVKITFPEEKRNLIIIYLESMETSFFSQAQGGALPYNVIPELYDLAKKNINFSHNQDIGGWPVVTNTTWTVASLVSQTSGVPLTIPVKRNTYGKKSAFLPGITNMQDVLKKNGYYQTVMFGSEGNYAGRDQYYYQHGADFVYDWDTAQKDGIIEKGYQVWWGMEDEYLYKYAKQELLEISKNDQPFAFSMLTVDTHHVGGYKCSLCTTQYEEQYENVYSCASKQLYSFICWLEMQDFYDDTTIIICGDHASMDAAYFERNVDRDYSRHMYNCIINSVVETKNTKDREFTPMDMFPTVLAAIGCEIEGNRLGLGTNLFSDRPTLAEEYTIDFLNDELGKSSSYYTNNFVKYKHK